jgi:hypothetical protein
MTMEFDSNARLAAHAGNHAGGASDWHGLRARLAAAHAARGVLVQENAGEQGVAGGSFDRGSARMLAVYGRDRDAGLSGINPSALGSGKPIWDNDAAVAGAPIAGV